MSACRTCATPAATRETHALHVKRVLDHVDVLGISAKRFKVVLDSINGAGCVVAATLLSQARLRGRPPQRRRPTASSPTSPSRPRRTSPAWARRCKRQQAPVGFAQDPDADRLAIVDENGAYIGEEYTLALAAEYVLSKKPGVAGGQPLHQPHDRRHGGRGRRARVVRTPVGEANVVEAMMRTTRVIGGEGNGGVIDPRVVPVRDSLVGMAYVLQLMAEHRQDRSASWSPRSRAT